MSIDLYPRAAPSDRLRVWIGAFQVNEPPTLSWFLNGNQTFPIALHEIASVRSDDMLSNLDLRRVFSGVYEFRGLQADTFYNVAVESGGERVTLDTRTLPASVPTQLDRWFNVLLISCFHAAEDKGGLAGIIVSQLAASSKPHLTILAGDQVYLDLPTLKDFPDDLEWLADKFEQDYALNWHSALAYRKVLEAAPSISIPDDHEYWNNFPHPSPFIGNSRFPGGQDRWRRAAQAAYDGFQFPYTSKLGEASVIDVSPLSFFVADTRSQKNIERQFTMSEDAHKQLDAWVSRVIHEKKFGVFVSGQSLFRKAAGKFTGSVGDYELPNYGDYGPIMINLQRLIDAGRPVLCLTGDVHWGRVISTKDNRTGRNAFTEIISSPASLVETVGADQFKKLKGVIGGIFGKKDPWPRHAEAEEPPAFLASDVLQKRFPCAITHRQRGNHVVLLRFRQHGSGLELRTKYWPIIRDAQIGKPVDVGPIDLIRA